MMLAARRMEMVMGNQREAEPEEEKEQQLKGIDVENVLS